MKLSNAISEYLDYCGGKTLYTKKGIVSKNRSLSPISIKNYKKILEFFIAHSGDIEISELSPEKYVSFINHMELNGWIGDNSRALLRRVLTRFFTVQIKLDRLENNPAEQILKENVRIDKPRVYLPIEKYSKLLEVVDGDNIQCYLMFSLMGSYGLRIAEVVGNESEGGNLRGFTLQDAEYLLSHRIVKVVGKGSKTREIDTIKQFHPDWVYFFRLLKQYIEQRKVDISSYGRSGKSENDRLFVYYKPEVNDKLKIYCLKSGIKIITPHKLRHTFGMMCIKTLGVEITSKYLGHEDIKTTQIYAEMDRTAIKDVIYKKDLVWKPED